MHGVVDGDSSSGKISKVTFAVDILRNSIVVCGLNGLVMFLRIRIIGPDVQPLYHDTMNIPTNLAIQAPYTYIYVSMHTYIYIYIYISIYMYIYVSIYTSINV